MDQSPATFEWTVQDVMPPQTLITSATRLGADDLENPFSMRFEVTGTDNGTVWFELGLECRVDGGPWSGCETPYHFVDLLELAGGEHTFEARAIDDFDNVDPSPASHTFTVAEEPETTILSGPLAESDATTAVFELGTDGSAGTTYQCALDGAVFTRVRQPGDLLRDRPRRARAPGAGGLVRRPCRRDAGGVHLGNRFDEPDHGHPRRCGLPPAETTATSATFAFSADDPTATFVCSLDGGPVAPCLSPHTVTDLEPGAHTFEVAPVKQHHLGVATAATHDWVVLDITSPTTTLTATPAAEISSETPAVFAFTTSELGATLECSLDGAAFARLHLAGRVRRPGSRGAQLPCPVGRRQRQHRRRHCAVRLHRRRPGAAQR